MPSPLTLPVRYTTHKPPCGARIRLSQPFARGLVGYWPLTERAGTPRDVVSGTLATLNGMVWGAGKSGAALHCPGAGAYLVTNVLGSFAPAQGSVWWRMMPGFAWNDGAEHYFWGSINTGMATPEFSAQKYSDNNWYVGWSTGADYRVTLAASAANLTQGVPQDYVFTWGAAGSVLYRNGVVIGSMGTAPSPSPTGNSFAWATEHGSSAEATANLGTGSTVEWGGVHNRALSAAEVRALYVAPYWLY